MKKIEDVKMEIKEIYNTPSKKADRIAMLIKNKLLLAKEKGLKPCRVIVGEKVWDTFMEVRSEIIRTKIDESKARIFGIPVGVDHTNFGWNISIEVEELTDFFVPLEIDSWPI